MQAQSPTILIVDDNIDFLKITSLILKTQGYETRTASSVVEAAIIVEEFSPDLMILDINLHGEDGREFCGSLKSRSGNDKMKVVMISGYEENLGTIAWAGADDFLLKPFEMDQLTAKIDFHLMNRRMNSLHE
jgi:DNA-binding response OmpR family regulator